MCLTFGQTEEIVEFLPKDEEGNVVFSIFTNGILLP